MHETLPLLVARALDSNPRPLEYYLREQSRLPGPRANLELVDDVCHLLVSLVGEEPDKVRALLQYLVRNDNSTVTSNTPAEFVILCGLVALGACAAVKSGWRCETYELLRQFANSPSWRLREGVALAYQRLLPVAPQETIDAIVLMATDGNYFQQRAAIAALAEPPLLHSTEIINAALKVQNIVLKRIHSAPASDRKREDFRTLRQALGYSLSVITAATPEKGFALMREYATWNDPDVTWILRENLKKKRLAKYVEHTTLLTQLLAR